MILLAALLTLGASLIGLWLAARRVREYALRPVSAWRIWLAPATVSYDRYAPRGRT